MFVERDPDYANGPLGAGAAYTDIRFPNGASPTAFTTNLANVSTGGLRDLETYGIGARYAFGPALVWGLWTHTRFEPVTAASSNLHNFEVGGKYACTSALYAGLGYTYSKLGGAFDGKWHQFNGVLDYALSTRTDVYLLAIYQKAAGSNTIAGKVVPVEAEIGSSTSYFGTSAGANNQFAARVGIRHKF